MELLEQNVNEYLHMYRHLLTNFPLLLNSVLYKPTTVIKSAHAETLGSACECVPGHTQLSYVKGLGRSWWSSPPRQLPCLTPDNHCSRRGCQCACFRALLWELKEAIWNCIRPEEHISPTGTFSSWDFLHLGGFSLPWPTSTQQRTPTFDILEQWAMICLSTNTSLIHFSSSFIC